VRCTSKGSSPYESSSIDSNAPSSRLTPSWTIMSFPCLFVQQVPFPYDLGVAKNVAAVLGRNPLAWLWPVDMPDDGTSYPTITLTDYGGTSAVSRAASWRSACH